MPSPEAIGVGMLGYAFMGKAHSRAFLAQRTLGTPLRPELVSISGRNAEHVEEARRHIVGWGDTFTHEIHHLLTAIAGEGSVAPHGATFEDGYRCAEVCNAIVRSAENGWREEIAYRGVDG